MKFYVGCKLDRADDQRYVSAALIAAGHELTYDWTTHGNVKEKGHGVLKKVADDELLGVDDAYFVVILADRAGRGTHCELGGAVILNKKTFLHSVDSILFSPSQKTCAFYHATCVHQVVGTLDDLVAAVLDWADGREGA